MTTPSRAEFLANSAVRKPRSFALPVSVLTLIMGFSCTPQVRGAVDLVITAITWTPIQGTGKGTLSVDQHVVFNATVQNIGNTAMTSSAVINVQFLIGGTTVSASRNTSALLGAKGSGTDTIVASWASMNAEAANQWLNTLPLGGMRDAAVQAFINQVGSHNPMLAAPWTTMLVDPGLRAKEMENLARTWLQVDPVAGRAWIETTTLPANVKQRLLNFPDV